jgi:hypothetical protein
MIFKQALERGTFPVLWKQSNVTPIFKKGSKLKPENYRPVSLTLVICKVLESLIHDRVVDFATSQGLLTNAQHGFRQGNGCTSNLLKACDIVTEAVHQGHAVDVI